MNIQALEHATLALGAGAEDALYYRIGQKYLYAGWTDLPYALIKKSTGSKQPMSPLIKTVLDMATGRVNYNLSFVPEAVRTKAAQLETAGVLERCAFAAPARLLTRYPNHYVSKAEWSVTGRCNFKCRHCFLSAPEARFGELSTVDCKRIIHGLAEAGILSIALTGGEPLLRTDFLELVDELLDCGINIYAISTNGSLVNDRLLDNLEERGLKPSFYMSFDGVGWHDWLRGIEGAEKMLMGKFELLAKRGFRTGSAFTMHRGNAGVLRQSINRLADVGASIAIINRMQNFGEWKKYGGDYSITHKELFETYLEYLPHFFEDGMPIKVELNRMITLYKHSYSYRISAIKPPADCSTAKVCEAAYRSLYITADGKATSCIAVGGMDGQQKNFADLLQMTVPEALEHSCYSACVSKTADDYFAVNPECAACPYKRFCRGGCRAQALEFDDTEFMGMDRNRCEFFFDLYTERILKRLAETVPEACCANLPDDYPLKSL